MDYFAEVGGNFEFIDIGKYFIFGLYDGLEAGEGFCLEVSGEKGFGEGVLEIGEGSKLLVVDGVRGEGCCPS